MDSHLQTHSGVSANPSKGQVTVASNEQEKERDVQKKLKLYGVIQAFLNGNLPDNRQIDSTLAYAEDHSPIDIRKLSPAGQQLIEDFRDIIGTAREIIAAKNPDELIQDTIYASAKVDNRGFKEDLKAGGEAGGADSANKEGMRQDGRQAAQHIKTLIHLFLTNGEVRKLVKDAGVVGRQLFATGASRAADRAAPGEEELDNLDKTADRAPQSAQARDPQRGMDRDQRKEHAKQKAQQAGQQLKGEARETVDDVLPEERRQRFIQRLKKAVVELQEDDEYNSSMKWLLDTFDQYKGQAASAAQGAAQGGAGNGQVQAVTEDWLTIIERFANNTPLTGVRRAVDQLYSDASNDPQLRQWWTNVSRYIRAVLLKPGYILEESSDREGQQLVEQGRNFFEGKYKGHWDALWDQVTSWLKEFDRDELNHQFGEDWHRLTKDLLFDADGKLTFKPELWQDIRQVILPSLIRHLGYFPIPRAEYTDDKLDLIVDNVVLSGPNLFPNIIELDNRNRFSFSPYDVVTDKSYNTVRIALSQIQADMRDVKFAFRKKSGFPKLSDSGFADVVVSGKGISVDILIEVIRPTRRDEVFRIGHVKTDVDELSFKLRDTKHDTLYKFIKPAATAAIKKAISKAIGDGIRSGLEWIDEQLTSVRNTMDDAKDTDGVSRQDALKQLYAHKKRSAEINKEKAKAKKEERGAQFALVTSPEQELFGQHGVDKAQDSYTNKALYQQRRAAQGPTWHSNAFTIVPVRDQVGAPGQRRSTRIQEPGTQNVYAAGGANQNDPRYAQQQRGGIAGQGQDPRYAQQGLQGQQGQQGRGYGSALGAGAAGAAAGAAGGYAAGHHGRDGRDGRDQQQRGTGAVFDPKTGKYENQGSWDKDHVKHAAGTAAGGAKFLPSADGANYVATHRSEDRTVHPDGTYTTHGGIETKTLINGKTGMPIKEKTSILDMNTGRYVEQPGSEIFFDDQGRPKGGSGFSGQQGQSGQLGQNQQGLQGQRGSTDRHGSGAGTAAALGAGAGALGGAAAGRHHGDKAHQAVYDKEGRQLAERDGRVDPRTGQFISGGQQGQRGFNDRDRDTPDRYNTQSQRSYSDRDRDQGRYNDSGRGYNDRDQSGRGYNQSGRYDDDDHHNRNRALGAGALGAGAGYAAGRHGRDHDDDRYNNQSGRYNDRDNNRGGLLSGDRDRDNNRRGLLSGDRDRDYDSRQNYPGSGRDNRATGAIYSGDRDRDSNTRGGDRGFNRQTGVRGQDDYDRSPDNSGRNAALGAGAGALAGGAFVAIEQDEFRRNPDGSWTTVRGQRAAGAFDSQGRPIAQESQHYDPQTGRYVDDNRNQRRIGGSNAGNTPLGITGGRNQRNRYDDDDDDYNRSSGFGRNQRGNNNRFDDDDDDYNQSSFGRNQRNQRSGLGGLGSSNRSGLGNRYDDDDDYNRSSGFGRNHRGNNRFDDDDDDYNSSNRNRNRALGAGALGAGAGALGGYAAGRRGNNRYDDDDDDYDNRRNFPGSGNRGTTAAFGRDSDRDYNRRGQGYDDRYDNERYGSNNRSGSGFGSNQRSGISGLGSSNRYDDDRYGSNQRSGFGQGQRGGRYDDDDDDYNQSSFGRNQRSGLGGIGSNQRSGFSDNQRSGLGGSGITGQRSGVGGDRYDDDRFGSNQRDRDHTGRNAALGAGAGALAGAGAYGASRRNRDGDESDADEFYDAQERSTHTPAVGGVSSGTTGTGNRAQQRADEIAQQYGVDSDRQGQRSGSGIYGSSGRGQRGGDTYTGDSAADYPHDTSGRYSSTKQETTVVGQPQRLHNRHGGGATGTEAVAPYGDDNFGQQQRGGNRSGTVGSYLDDDRNRSQSQGQGSRGLGGVGVGGYNRRRDDDEDKYGNALDGTDHRHHDEYSGSGFSGQRGQDYSSSRDRNIAGAGGWANPAELQGGRNTSGTFGRSGNNRDRDYDRYDDEQPSRSYRQGDIGRGDNEHKLAQIAGVAGAGAGAGALGGYAAGRRGNNNRYDDDDDDYNRSGNRNRQQSSRYDDDDYNRSGSYRNRNQSSRYDDDYDNDRYGSGSGSRGLQQRGGQYGSSNQYSRGGNQYGRGNQYDDDDGPIIIAGAASGPGYEERFIGVIDDANLGEDRFSSHSQRANPALESSQSRGHGRNVSSGSQTQASPTSRGPPIVTGAYDSNNQGSGPTGAQAAHAFDRAKRDDLEHHHDGHHRSTSGNYGSSAYGTSGSNQRGPGTKEYTGQGAQRSDRDNTGDLTGRSGHDLTGSAADRDLSGRSAGATGATGTGSGLSQGQGYGSSGAGIHTGPSTLSSGAGTGAGIGATGAGSHVAGTNSGNSGNQGSTISSTSNQPGSTLGGISGAGLTGTGGGISGASGNTERQHIPGEYHDASDRLGTGATSGTTSAGGTSGGLSGLANKLTGTNNTTGNNVTGTGLTGNTTGSGLTGSNTTGTSGLTGSNTTGTGSGLTGSSTTGTGTHNRDNEPGLLEKAKEGISNLVSSDKK